MSLKTESKALNAYCDEVLEELSQLPPMEWTVSDEIALCTAIDDRPIGAGVRNFKMARITERFHEISGKSVLVETIWEKLNEMFNLELLENDDDDIYVCHCNQCKFDIVEDFVLEQSIYDDVNVPVFKDYTRQKKKEESSPPPTVATPKVTPSVGSASESEEEDLPLVKPIKGGRKSKVQTPSAKRDTPKRGRKSGVSTKDSSPGPARTKKIEEETSTKKERGSIVGRSLRSRTDDDGTPPPKRARRN